jgi:hypothetical protein
MALPSMPAWEGQEEYAIGFNDRNGSAGRLPRSVLATEDKLATPTSILVPYAPYNGQPSLGRLLTWKAGDCIRVCKWDKGEESSGTGFNIATGQIGRFRMECLFDIIF